MPEEDDDALGEMLGERLKESAVGSEADEDGEGADTEAEQSTESTDATESTGPPQPTRSTQPTPDEATVEPSTDDEAERDTARSRSPFPLYVSPDAKEAVQDRFEKFNAERTLNDEPQVEKHKHFMEGLLRAGLDHPDLEEYVLEEYEER